MSMTVSKENYLNFLEYIEVVRNFVRERLRELGLQFLSWWRDFSHMPHSDSHGHLPEYDEDLFAGFKNDLEFLMAGKHNKAYSSWWREALVLLHLCCGDMRALKKYFDDATCLELTKGGAR